MLNCRFTAASKTLLTFGKNELNGTPGFLANRNRQTNLKVIRKLLKLPAQLAKTQASLEEMMLQLIGIDITTCPCGNKGKMQLLAQIPSYRARAPNHLACVAA
jgi:hypothetical protein